MQLWVKLLITFFSVRTKSNWYISLYFNLVIKVNIWILVRVIKEMTTMQSAGENQTQQLR